MCLRWNTTLYRIRAWFISDTSRCIRGKSRAHSFCEQFNISSRHRGYDRANTRPQHACGPEILEVCERFLHTDFSRLNRVEARRRPQFGHCSDPTSSDARWIYWCNPHPAHLNTDRLQWKATAEHIPRVRCDYATRTHHSHHLSNAFGRVRNKEYHQRHNRYIKRICWKWKSHCIANAELCEPCGRPCTRKGKLAFGRVNAMDLGR